jgi:uncharacterized membrane protein
VSGVTLELRPPGPAGTLLLLAAAALAAVWAYRVWRDTPEPGRRWARVGLRLASVFLLAALFLQPVWGRRSRIARVPVAVVLDGSESMAARDQDGRARWAAVTARVSEGRSAWERFLTPVYYVLDRTLRRRTWEELEQAAPSGAASDLSVLERVPTDAPEARAVLLFSDGRAGGGRDPAAVLPRSGLPLWAVGVGAPDTSPDLLVDSVRAPRFAFKNTDVEVQVRVAARSMKLGEVSLSLTKAGETQAVRSVKISPETGAADATLTFRPTATGPQTYEVRLPVFESENNRRNNRASFSLDVSRDRVRVLFISGQPGPSYAFLRHQLKSHPSVELVSFVILRDPEDAVSVPDGQLALIPFPTPDALIGQLGSFDVVVLEEFSFGSFGIGPAGLTALRDYVEKGGGLLLVGDRRVLGPNGPYRGSPLEESLPVSLADQRPAPPRFTVEAADAAHPVMALGAVGEASRGAWSALPALEEDTTLPAAVRPGAQALAVARVPGGPFPVAAAWRRGRGRVMTVHALTTWRWALGESGRGRGTEAYQRFWQNAVRWLSAAEDLRPVKTDLPRETVGVGEEWLLRTFVRDDGFAPLASARVEAVLESPDGGRERVTLKSLGNGEYAESATATAPGTYRVTVAAFDRGRRLGTDEGLVRAGLLWQETRDTSTDFHSLAALARSTGGDFTPLSGFTPEWLAERARAASWTRESRKPVWDSGLVLACLVLLLAADWWLRRRWGDA